MKYRKNKNKQQEKEYLNRTKQVNTGTQLNRMYSIEQQSKITKPTKIQRKKVETKRVNIGRNQTNQSLADK